MLGEREFFSYNLSIKYRGETKPMQEHFSFLQKHPEITYLDSASSSLKLDTVLDRLRMYWEDFPVNVFRGVYAASEQATTLFEETRAKTAAFLGSDDPREIVFTRNTTESLNLLADVLTRSFGAEDEVLVTAMEHHSNLVPWQEYARRRGFRLKILPFCQAQSLDPEKLSSFITEKTRIFAFTHASNVLGTINDVTELIRTARKLKKDILTIVDAAQSAPHLPLNVREMDCDFLAFSAHKLYGPTGVGLLYGKYALLEKLPPFLLGGGMVESVTLQETTFQDPPARFEAGTPAIAEVIAFAAALDFLESYGRERIAQEEAYLTRYAYEKLSEAFGAALTILGPPPESPRSALLSFTLQGIHPHDIATILAEENICIRAGSHCAIPLHQELGFPCAASARVSFGIYNTEEDIEKLLQGLKKAQRIFSRRA